MTEIAAISGVGRLRRANKAETAEFFEVSPNSIDAWVRRGCPAVERGGARKPWVFDLLDVARWRLVGESSGGEVDPESLNPGERKSWYEGEARRRELAEKARELIPVAEVEQAVATAYAAIAQGIRAIPDNLERRHGIDPAVAERVEEALHAEMDALADRLAQLAPVGCEGAGE